MTGVPTPNHQEWINLASATPPSTIFLEGLHIRPTQKLSTATKSTHLKGFTFVGTGTLPRSTTKGERNRSGRCYFQYEPSDTICSYSTSLQEKKIFERAQASARIRSVLIAVNVVQSLIADIDIRKGKRSLASRSGACS